MLAVVYHLLLQDRAAEARGLLAAIPRSGVTAATATAATAAASPALYTLQRDYLDAYLSFFDGDEGLAVAEEIVKRYEKYPVPLWKKLFDEIRAELQEIKTGIASEFDATAQGDASTAPAAATAAADSSKSSSVPSATTTLVVKQPSLDFTVANETVEISSLVCRWLKFYILILIKKKIHYNCL